MMSRSRIAKTRRRRRIHFTPIKIKLFLMTIKYMYLSEGIPLLPRNIPQPYLPYILPTPNFQVFFLLSNRPARFQFQIVPNALPLFEKFDQVCIFDIMMLSMLKCCEFSEVAPFT